MPRRLNRWAQAKLLGFRVERLRIHRSSGWPAQCLGAATKKKVLLETENEIHRWYNLKGKRITINCSFQKNHFSNIVKWNWKIKPVKWKYHLSSLSFISTSPIPPLSALLVLVGISWWWRFSKVFHVECCSFDIFIPNFLPHFTALFPHSQAFLTQLAFSFTRELGWVQKWRSWIDISDDFSGYEKRVIWVDAAFSGVEALKLGDWQVIVNEYNVIEAFCNYSDVIDCFRR